MKKKIMKKKITSFFVVVMILMSACGKTTDSPVIQDIAPETPPAPMMAEPAAEPYSGEERPETPVGAGRLKTITDREIIDGKMQSYLTGEWKSANIVQRRPMAVMVPNNLPAMPQYGISRASIIYEAPVEGRISRLMCVFEDYDDLDHVGPVRSSRDYFVYEAMALDAIYCNWGLAVPYVSELINSDRVDNISQSVSGIDNPYPAAFDKIDRPGYATEYTGYMFISGYEKGIAAKGYAKTYDESGRFAEAGRGPQAFCFADDGARAEYKDYPDAVKIYPGGKNSNQSGYGLSAACFTYNAEDHLYYRSQYGMEQIDEWNGEQLAVSNVVFKICQGEVRDRNDYLIFGCHGTGDAYVFTNGKMIRATWEHNGDYGANYLYDEDGGEIILNQGKTWICNIWDDYVKFAEADGQKLF